MLFLLASFALIGTLSAATTCSAEAYAKACSKCSFDSYNKMNKTCYDDYISSGSGCLSSSYPVLAASYKAGKCPQVDTCKTNLDICKGALSSGNDKADCNVAAMKECYSEADKIIKSSILFWI